MHIRSATLFFTLLSVMAQCQIPLPEDMPAPKLAHQALKVDRDVAMHDSFVSIIFDEINYELNGKFYIQNGSVNDNNVLSPDHYDNKLAQSCNLYPTTLFTDLLDRYTFSDEADLLKYTHSGDSSVFLLNSQQQVTHLKVSEKGVTVVRQHQLEDGVVSIVDGRLAEDVEMLVIGKYLYIFAKSYAHRLDTTLEYGKFLQMGGYSAKGY